MEPFLGEIRMFAGNFPPRGWALCNGQTIPLRQNTALFSLLGTTYGGDGFSTFALPNLQARTPVHAGTDQGPGLTQRVAGETGGVESVTLDATQLPRHSHQAMASSSAAGAEGATADPAGALPGAVRGTRAYAAPGATRDAALAPSAVVPAGGSLPHNNMPPYLTVTFIIALQGIFPSRP